MRLIIAGGRDYKPNDEDYCRVWDICIEIKATEIVSGGASGADRWGEEFAKENEMPLTIIPADWKTHGRAAGPMRNQYMAEYADAVVLFPGGRGTESMHKCATREGIRIFDLREVEK
jgi:hypothetical protein